MRLDPLQQSGDIEDRRGTSSGGGILGSGAGRIGIGGMILAAVRILSSASARPRP